MMVASLPLASFPPHLTCRHLSRSTLLLSLALRVHASPEVNTFYR
jgi:hypothetical protein